MTFKDKYIHKFYAFALAAVFAIALAGCGGGGGTAEEPPPPMPTPQETCEAAGNHYVDGECLTPAQVTINAALANIAAATTAEEAQAAYDAVKDDVTATQGDTLQAAVDARIMAINLAARVDAQKMALADAAGMIDTSDLSTQEMVDAANEGIRALRQALEDAEDVGDEDKEMYQTQLDDAVTAVDGAQDGINTATRRRNQMTALSDASTALQAALAVLAGSTPTQEQLDAANNALTGLNTAITDAADLTDAEKATYVREAGNAAAPINTAQMAFDAAEDEDQKAAAKASAELGKQMYGALSDDAPAAPVRQRGLFALSADGKLTINSPSSGGPGRFEGDDFPDSPPANWVGDAASTLGGWAGISYAHTHATTKVGNEARVYHNRGPGKRVTFAKAGYTVATETAGTAIKGYVEVVTAGSVNTGFDITDVKADAFTHSGTQTHQKAERAEALYVRGTYDGAPGEYRCVTGCSSTNDGKGSPTSLAGTWHFKPDAGAMVHQPDADYLYFGWWVNKNKDGEPMVATAFVGAVGTPATGWSGAYDDTAGSETLTGSATYAGDAAGKFAITNALDGTGSGGHFTADANLTAKFSGTGAGVTGTIDNFRLNDGTEDPGWSVELGIATLGTDGAFASRVDDSATTDVNEATMPVWSINGNKGAPSGSWGGTMYDEMPGDAPDGDGSNIPTTVTGTFYSTFSNIGRMVGGFGATKQ